MQDNDIDLDQLLEGIGSVDVQAEKLKIYEAILASILRKYVPANRKIDLNLYRAYTDTILNITLNDDGNAKISWGECNAGI